MENTIISPWLDKKIMGQWLGSPVKEICEKDTASNKGDNYMSALHHLSVITCASENYNLLIKKCVTGAGAIEELLIGQNAFKREEDAYAIVIPKILQLLHKALPGNRTICIWLRQCVTNVASNVIEYIKVENTMNTPWQDKKVVEKWLGISVKEIHENDSRKEEDNMSTMHRLLVTTNEGKSYLVIKMPPGNQLREEILNAEKAFQKERDVYSIVIPRIIELLHKSPLVGNEEFGPKCYFACKNFLVMDDLIAQGYYMKNRRIGLDFDDCLLVMQTLAKFHASSAVLYEKDPKTMNTFSNFYTEPVVQKAWNNWLIGMSLTLAEELDTWPEEWKKYAKKIRSLSENFMKLVTVATKQNDLGFSCLLHGDLWTNNMLFNDKGSLRLIDYQIAYFGSPAQDIHYFLNTSANADVRYHQFDQLIQEYHTTLIVTLKALGYKKKIITLQELQEELDRKIILALFSLIVPFAIMSSDPKCEYNIDDAMREALTPGPKMYGEWFKEMIKLQLPQFEKKGAFERDLHSTASLTQ